MAGRPATRPAAPPTVGLGRLDDFFGFRLRRLQNRLSRDFATATADRNLRSGLFTSLAIIAANPGISQADLAAQVGLDKSVMVSIVDELERSGWARRERSTVDRRRHSLFITEGGESYLSELFNILEATERAAREHLSAAEFRLLNELLDRVFDALTADAAAAGQDGL